MKLTYHSVAITHENDIAWAENIESELKHFNNLNVEVVAMYPPRGQRCGEKDHRAFVFKDLDSGEMFRSFASLAFFEDGSPMTWVLNYKEKVKSKIEQTEAWKRYVEELKRFNVNEYERVDAVPFIDFKLAVFDNFVPID